MMEYEWDMYMSEVTVYMRNELGVFSIATISEVFTEEQAALIAEEVYHDWENR